jgi:hypothetical protein
MTPKEKEYSRFKQVCVIKNNPKQKAEYLVWKFGKCVNQLDMNYQQAKECALIAVDEVFQVLPDIQELWEHWQEVKQEIEKL